MALDFFVNKKGINIKQSATLDHSHSLQQFRASIVFIVLIFMYHAGGRAQMIVFATNVHVGGGKVLLDSLLLDEPFGSISAAFLDARYNPPKSSKLIEIFKYQPTVKERLKAQIDLKRFCANQAFDNDILFFGNHPPFFNMRGQKIVYLQNCFLLSGVPLPKDSIYLMLRNAIERGLLKVFRRNIDEIWVQTDWMVELCKANFPSVKTTKRAFLPKLPVLDPQIPKEYDFICVASESKHKNIEALVRVMESVDTRSRYLGDNKVHFLLVLPTFENGKLRTFLESSHQNIKLSLIVSPTREQLFKLYQQSRNIIVPSEYESFCLPLYEAHHFGVGILAHDRPFFREASFINEFVNMHDPQSASDAILKLMSKHSIS